MPSPVTRIVGALVMLGLYYGVLHALAVPDDSQGRAIREAIVESEQRFAAGAFGEALEPTLFVIEHMPSQPVYLERLAQIYRRLERAQDEALAWKRFMSVSATPQDGCPMISEALTRAGDPSSALQALERCVTAAPDNPDFHLYVGQAYAAMGRDADARRAFEAGLALEPNYPDLHLVSGIRDYADKRIAEARAHFERFLALAPERRPEVEVWLQRTQRR